VVLIFFFYLSSINVVNGAVFNFPNIFVNPSFIPTHPNTLVSLSLSPSLTPGTIHNHFFSLWVILVAGTVGYA